MLGCGRSTFLFVVLVVCFVFHNVSKMSNSGKKYFHKKFFMINFAAAFYVLWRSKGCHPDGNNRS